MAFVAWHIPPPTLHYKEKMETSNKSNKDKGENRDAAEGKEYNTVVCVLKENTIPLKIKRDVEETKKIKETVKKINKYYSRMSFLGL